MMTSKQISKAIVAHAVHKGDGLYTPCFCQKCEDLRRKLVAAIKREAKQ